MGRLMRGLPWLLPLGTVGCFWSSPGEQSGELGNGVFTWVCTSGADQACTDNVSPDDFPDAIAVGSTFQLTYRSNGGLGYTPQAGSRHLQESFPGGSFTAIEPGWASVIVYKDRAILDFIHLDLRTVDRFEMPIAGTSSSVEVGETTQVQASPICGDALCAGSLPYAWSIDDPSVLALQPSDEPDNRVTIRGISAGTARLSVTSDDLDGAVTITVTGTPPTDTGSGTTGSGSTSTGGTP